MVCGHKFDFPPPIPLGDDHHSPLHAAIAHHARDFFKLLSWDVITDPDQGYDVNAPLACGDTYEALQEMGTYFSVHVDELNWTQSTESCVHSMSYSELILRMWYALYLNQHLSVTQFEHALVQESTGMKALLEFSIHIHTGYLKQPPEMMGMAYCNKLLKQGLEGAHFDLVQVGPGDKPDVTCNYCGTNNMRALCCLHCKCTIYCNRDCQKSDFKHHKPLCLHLSATQKTVTTVEELTEAKKPAANPTP